MCLILFAIEVHPSHPLILIANRDEFYERPSKAMHWWTKPEILAGQDQRGEGTWLGIDRGGRWAAVTNFRGKGKNPESPRTRGELVPNFLQGDQPARNYLQLVCRDADKYRGFNLLVGDSSGVYYFGNRGQATGQSNSNARNSFDPLSPGIYGLCNHRLQTPWPKVELGKRKLNEAIQSNAIDHQLLFQLLTDTARPPENELPNTGVGLETEILLSSMFIKGESYGTRCSTSLLFGPNGQVDIAERTFPSGDICQFDFVSSIR